jgi:hypothetical protein
MYQPKTGQPCHCKRGVQRDNCPDCEGTGMRIDFNAIRARNALTVTRYVVTHINKDGMRTLAQPCQGRYTYATTEEAQSVLDAMMQNNSLDTLKQFYGLPLEVRACECYAGHFDPVRVWFDWKEPKL